MRMEAGEEALWKSVMTSSVLCYATVANQQGLSIERHMNLRIET